MNRFILTLLLLFSSPGLLSAAETGSTVTHTEEGWLFYTLSVIILIVLSGIAIVSARLRRQHETIRQLNATLNERTESLIELNSSRETYRELYDLALVAIFRSTIDGEKFISINQTGAEMFGYSSAREMIKFVVPRLLHIPPESRPVVLGDLRNSSRITNVPVTLRRRDGSAFFAIFSATINVEEGYIEGTIQDVTQLKEAQLALMESHDYLQAVIDAIPIPIFVRDTENRYTLANDEFSTTVGISKDQLLGKRPEDFLPGQLMEQIYEQEKPLWTAKGKASQKFEWLWPLADPPRYDLIYNEIMMDAGGKQTGLVTAIVDITTRKRMEEALREAEERYREIYMNAVEGIFTSTWDGIFLGANPAMARLYGYQTPDEMLKKVENLATEHWVNPDQRQQLLSLLTKESTVSGYEVEIIKQNGEHIWVSLSVRLVQEDMQPYLEGIAKDITEQKLSSLALSLRASTDPLTGLSNRSNMEHSFEHMIAQAKRSGEKIGVLFIDLDGFKPINDTYGHEAGDTLLREVSERIRKRVRDADLAARMGGDEFVIILWDIKDTEGLYRIGRELLEELNSHYVWNGIPLRMGASIGGCIYPDHGDSAADLLRCADKAMYTIKQSGKNALRITRIPDNACKPRP